MKGDVIDGIEIVARFVCHTRFGICCYQEIKCGGHGLVFEAVGRVAVQYDDVRR
jgi:hypothetical protein